MKSEEFATAINKRKKKREVWTWRMLLCAAFFTLHSSLFTSCSEEDTEEEEFANWQVRNDAATNDWAANSSFKKIVTYTKDQTASLKNSDYIYVEVLETGSGKESPIYSDTCRVAYRGRLIPTNNYPEGYVFDQNFKGDFSWGTCGATDFALTSSLRDGFATALQNMHVGDRWRVYSSYTLGYGATTSGSIPAYSNLIFDIALIDFWHPGEQKGIFKSR